MPIVDGLTSTKMIRSFEKTHASEVLSPSAAFNGRAPIFAVSASLVEKDRQKYIDAGFDAWILKPVDFKRLNVLLAGIMEEEERNASLYKPGQWERGGWFANRQADIPPTNTAPSGKLAVAEPPGGPAHDSALEDSFDDPISKEQSRLRNLDDDAVRADSKPEDPGTSGDIEASTLTEE